VQTNNRNRWFPNGNTKMVKDTLLLSFKNIFQVGLIMLNLVYFHPISNVMSAIENDIMFTLQITACSKLIQDQLDK
jgi:hypothetical protein